MIFNQPNSLRTHSVFKNSDKSGGLPHACYSVNALEKEKCAPFEQFLASQGQRIIRSYEGYTPRNVHIDGPHQSSKISNKKQSP